MGKAFRRLYYHAVWATKNRAPQIAETRRPTLFEAIGETCRRLDCALHAVNAMEDHVHVALEIPPARAVSFVLGQIKGASSRAMNQMWPESTHWQDGYGVVTFRRNDLEQIKHYIATQAERHRTGKLSPTLETWEEDEDAD
jgi:putative transposase